MVDDCSAIGTELYRRLKFFFLFFPVLVLLCSTIALRCGAVFLIDFSQESVFVIEGLEIHTSLQVHLSLVFDAVAGFDITVYK